MENDIKYKNVRIELELHDKVKELSKLEFRNVTGQINFIIRDWLNESNSDKKRD
jgi:hypothetical protein